MSRSLVVYRGPSRYDAKAQIRAVLVLKSRNAKTGNMAQLNILHDTIAPHVAQQSGADAAVCGACPLRPALSGGCYVVTCQGPLSTWKATRRTPEAGALAIRNALRGRALRLGAYGDVAALPPHVVTSLVRMVDGRVTGYTHGHRLLGMAGVKHLRESCMLSVESEREASRAHLSGWRTFRSRAPSAPLMSREIDCPSERGVECADCLLCRGASIGAKSIAIEVHGSRVSRALTVVQSAA